MLSGDLAALLTGRYVEIKMPPLSLKELLTITLKRCECSTNENISKIIRRFLPKGTDFRKVTAEYIKHVEI